MYLSNFMEVKNSWQESEEEEKKIAFFFYYQA